MAKVYTAVGRVLRGEFRVPRDMRAAFRSWRDCRVQITVEKLYATRSKAQNDFYWAVVVPRVMDHFVKRKIIQVANPQLVHEILKSQFMDYRLVQAGEIRGFVSDTGLLIGTHTPDLNKLQFIEYLERIGEHAAAYWDGLYIQPPDPQWREHAERESALDPSGATDTPVSS